MRKLASQVVELGSGLENVKALLEQRSPTVNDAQNALKVCVFLGLCLCLCLCVCCDTNLLICMSGEFVHVSIFFMNVS